MDPSVTSSSSVDEEGVPKSPPQSCKSPLSETATALSSGTTSHISSSSFASNVSSPMGEGGNTSLVGVASSCTTTTLQSNDAASPLKSAQRGEKGVTLTTSAQQTTSSFLGLESGNEEFGSGSYDTGKEREKTTSASSDLAGITDPTGRYERSNELLGRGASKEVYKAFDHEEGVEVAWNQLKVGPINESSATKILSEIQILTQLNNENVIRFYHSWVRRNSSTGNYDVFFITELMTSGTLKNYLQKTKGPIKLKVIKGWCRQILKALQYLHTMSPPIIHRDLKCDNVFINGNNGQTKLGDFGLAVLKNREMMTSVLGTPEFMAPELYEESYDERVDIYAFGMVMLEMVTKEYPYSECDNAAQIYRKVTQGIQPLALQQISDPETKCIIEQCLNADPSQRPTVTDLLEHDYFVTCPATCSSDHQHHYSVSQHMTCSSSTTQPNSATGAVSPLDSANAPPTVTSIGSSRHSSSVQSPTMPVVDSLFVPPSDRPASAIGNMSSASTTANVPSVQTLIQEESSASKSAATTATAATAKSEALQMLSCQVDVDGLELPVVHLAMHVTMSQPSASKEVKFPFDFERDTVSVVVGEMIRERVLDDDSCGEMVSKAIRAAIKEPLAMYEMALAKAPARAEMDQQQETEDAAAIAAATSDQVVESNTAQTNSAPSQSNSSTGDTQTSSNSATPVMMPSAMEENVSLNATVQASTSEESIGNGNGNNGDHAIEDHPEVAALLLRQKKEIDLIALFHRREYQVLLRTLRKQQQSSGSEGEMYHHPHHQQQQQRHSLQFHQQQQQQAYAGSSTSPPPQVSSNSNNAMLMMTHGNSSSTNLNSISAQPSNMSSLIPSTVNSTNTTPLISTAQPSANNASSVTTSSSTSAQRVGNVSDVISKVPSAAATAGSMMTGNPLDAAAAANSAAAISANQPSGGGLSMNPSVGNAQDTSSLTLHATGASSEADELHFMAQVRHLMYESTGNAAWLPDHQHTAIDNATAATRSLNPQDQGGSGVSGNNNNNNNNS